jgi:D-beta-D-heptose 7-phosphate kinase/D-beta-D-heptose 1-phosphate adenosyltransferase
MLDHRIDGRVTRRTPDDTAPIIVPRVETTALGGAGRCVQVAAKSGWGVTAAGVLGVDFAADVVRCLVPETVCLFAVADPSRMTTVKQYIRDGHLLLRIDWESCGDWMCPEGWMRDLCAIACETHVVILVDYCKGVVTPTLLDQLRRTISCPIVLASKRPPLRHLRGVHMILNEKEFKTLINHSEHTTDEQMCDEANRLVTSEELSSLTITLGERGALSVSVEGARLVETEPLADVDVIGAGDVFAVHMSAYLARGVRPFDAVKLANASTRRELAHDFFPSSEGMRMHSEACPINSELDYTLSCARALGRRIVFTNGCFDLLHPGHLSLFRRAREAGDLLVVAINDDRSVRRLKGNPRPFLPLSQRVEMLHALRWIDIVVPFAEDTPLELIKQIRPDVIVKGADYSLGEIVGAREVLSWGGELIRVPLVGDYSTTGLANRIADSGK